MRRLILALLLLAAPVAALDLDRSPTQGALVRGRVAPGTPVSVNDSPVQVSPEGWFVFGVARDAKGSVTVQAGGKRQSFPITARQFDIQRIDGLPQDKVTPDPALTQRITAESAKIRTARSAESAEKGFSQSWIWPAKGRMSGVYGSQRILNGAPRSPHYGVDVAAPTGTVAVSPADGVISLAEPDLFFTGGSLMIDHGHGVQSIFAHLSAIDVKPGDRVRQGQPVGRIGATGRVTGPHLHWGVYWRQVPVDPALLMPTPVP